jgi:cobalt-zinc-cadmium efflux system outer membrane protein
MWGWYFTMIEDPSMRNRRRALALAASVLLLGACHRLSPSLRHRLDAEASGMAPKIEDDRAVRAAGDAAVAPETPPPAAWSIPADAGLEQYVAEALVRNPAVRRAIREAQALGQRVPQVTSLDDPMVTIIPPTGDMIQTAAGMMNAQAGVTQKLPFPGKLATRGRIAEQEVRIALDRLADARIRAVTDVTRAYFAYYLADVSIRLTDQSVVLLRQIRDVAAARYRAGAATQEDVLRAEVELYGLTNELITLDQARSTAVARLNAAMNRQVDGPLPAPRPFDLAHVEWRLDEATKGALSTNPQLVAMRDQVRRNLERVHLARLDYLPDLVVGYSYTAIAAPALSPVATGEDAWNLGLGFNVPLWWWRRRAQVVEGNAQVLASIEELEDTRNRIVLGIQEALVRIDTQYRQAVLFRDLLVPRAWQAVEAALASYRSGRTEFTGLVEVWRKWLDSALAYQRALAGLEQSFADLQQLVGVRIARAPAPPPPVEVTPPADERTTP